MDTKNIGDLMTVNRNKTIKGIAFFASVVVYVAGIIYAEVHGFSMMARGVDPDFLIWAQLGMVALGLTALALPLAIHYWTHAPAQYFAAMAFYAVDLGLLIFNAVVDFAIQSGGELPAWGVTYAAYIVPATPILCALGWTVIWLLDPESKELAMREQLGASTREALALRVAEAAKDADIDSMVAGAAAEMARNVVTSVLGHAVDSTSSHSVIRDNRAKIQPVVQPLAVPELPALAVEGVELPEEIRPKSPARKPARKRSTTKK